MADERGNLKAIFRPIYSACEARYLKAQCGEEKTRASCPGSFNQASCWSCVEEPASSRSIQSSQSMDEPIRLKPKQRSKLSCRPSQNGTACRVPWQKPDVHSSEQDRWTWTPLHICHSLAYLSVSHVEGVH